MWTMSSRTKHTLSALCTDALNCLFLLYIIKFVELRVFGLLHWAVEETEDRQPRVIPLNSARQVHIRGNSQKHIHLIHLCISWPHDKTELTVDVYATRLWEYFTLNHAALRKIAKIESMTRNFEANRHDSSSSSLPLSEGLGQLPNWVHFA